jgi:hypothetical protein
MLLVELLTWGIIPTMVAVVTMTEHKLTSLIFCCMSRFPVSEMKGFNEVSNKKQG